MSFLVWYHLIEVDICMLALATVYFCTMLLFFVFKIFIFNKFVQE
jgi:hypothetical protein